MRRAFVIVLDACGFGALPDAEDYGDAGTNTLGHLAEHLGGLDLPTLGALGLGSIAPLTGVAPAPRPVLHGRLHALGFGKDSSPAARRPPTRRGSRPRSSPSSARRAGGASSATASTTGSRRSSTSATSTCREAT
jgi:hypothetical protein